MALHYQGPSIPPNSLKREVFPSFAASEWLSVPRSYSYSLVQLGFIPKSSEPRACALRIGPHCHPPPPHLTSHPTVCEPQISMRGTAPQARNRRKRSWHGHIVVGCLTGESTLEGLGLWVPGGWWGRQHLEDNTGEITEAVISELCYEMK